VTEWLFGPNGGALPGLDDLGGKGHHLARLSALAASDGFRVPRFVVLRAAAFAACVPDRIEPEAWRAQVRALECPARVRAALVEALAALPRGVLLAVRSSASLEDGSQRSFAGQFETVLGVRADPGDPDALWQAVRRVWASAAGAHALAYQGGRDARGLAMAVVIQEMVDAAVAGVAFSSDPVSGDRDTVVVSAVLGLGEGLVSGELDADTYRVRFVSGAPSRPDVTPAHKPRAVRLAPSGGTRVEDVPEGQRDAPSLGDDEALAIAGVARRIAEASGAPQDIEWALHGPSRELVVLQARPITTLAARQAPLAPWVDARDRERHVWDNSNIIESYGGVTTPLTFTFARAVYEDVYRQFCRLMGTPETLIASHAAVFANMLGLVRGRVYYDLLNWYRTLALLPGFTWNRAFMERMMGVREALLDAPAPPGTGSRLRDLWMLMRMIVRLVREARRLRREVPAFHARIERALGPVSGADIERWPAARALELHHRLEAELLRHWRTPLVNDFFAMIFFGALGRLTQRWLPDSPPTLVNDLLCGEGGIVSTEPSRRLMDMARRVAAEPALRAAVLEEQDARRLLARLAELPGGAVLRADLDAYLERFGDRCMEELKLETITLREDPSFLVHTLRAYVTHGRLDADAAWQRERAVREAAERTVQSKLHGSRRWAFGFVLARVRLRVRDRENLRFERTRVFGVVRRIFLALGADLARRGAIDTARDVFLLTREELLAASAAAPARSDLRGLVAARRAEFERYARETPPPDRFESIGPPTGREWLAPESKVQVARAADLHGTGCCPGVVRAPVRVVRDPREARGLEGHILVAERTDPGWTVLFPTVAGLLVQRGSLLSHSAIVAREMGIPCVVGIAGLLDTLTDGEQVEMDGTTGAVRRGVVAS
jgi:pyruvate,water dikinase